MDLPTCPACKQSVLDDDAAECPFCGASLKDGSGARPKSPPATRPAAPKSAAPKAEASNEPATRPGAARPSAPPAVKPGKADDDDPFAEERAADVKAVPVSPRPGPGKTLEVKCPMCETAGYVSPKAAGQAVKCCNPKCLVPVFTAPAPPKKPEPPPPPPKAKIPVLAYVCAAVVIAGVATLVVFKLQESSNPTSLGPGLTNTRPPAPKVETGSGAAGPGENGGKAALANGKAAKAAIDVPPAIETPQAQISQALARLVTAAREAPQLRKSVARRYSASAFAAAGDLKAARDELDQLQRVGRQTAYEGCLPTVQLAWKQLESSPADFAKSVAEARELFGKYGKLSRAGLDGAIAVAAVTVASGKPDDARRVLDAQQRSPELNQLGAALQVVQNDGTYDLDAPLVARGPGGWLAPQSAAVALILAAHGRWDDARSWADKAPGAAARADATVAWAEAFARQTLASGSSADLQPVSSAADSQEPAVQARLFARLARVQLEAGDRPAAEKLLARSVELLGTLTPPAPIQLRDAPALAEWNPPDVVPLRLAAIAAADAGAVQAKLGQSEAAWKSFQLALSFLRGIAPGLTYMQERVAETANDAARIQKELKVARQLRSDEDARQALARYRTKCEELYGASLRRFFWQSDVLEAAVAAGLLEQVWNEIQTLNKAENPVQRDPVLASSATVLVADAYGKSGKPAVQQTIRTAAQQALRSAPPEIQSRAAGLLIAQLVATGDIAEATKQFGELQNDTGALHELSLRLACRLVTAGKLAEAYALVSGLRDQALRDDGIYLVSALAGRLGKARDVWAYANAEGKPDFLPIAAGMVAGLSSAINADKRG